MTTTTRRYITTKFGMTAAGHVEALKDDTAGRRLPWRWNGPRPVFFHTKDGRICALTRDAIDRGLPQAAGVRIIDGDKLDELEPAGAA